MKSVTRLALVAAVLVALSDGKLQADDNNTGPRLTVTGSGSVTARPDQAVIMGGVVTEDASPAAAVKKNSQAVNDLFAALEELGIAKKEIQTAQFRIAPQYHHEPKSQQPPKIVGYQVVNEVRIQVRDISSLGRVLDELVTRGANQIDSVRFTIGDTNRLMDEARRKAVADAQRRARVLAEASGEELNRIFSIRENPSPPPRPLNLSFKGMAAGAVPTEPGEQEIQTTVEIIYSIGRAVPGKTSPGVGPAKRQ